MVYKVEITETLQRVIEIESKDENLAYVVVKQLYKDGSIVLDSSDYVDTVICALT